MSATRRLSFLLFPLLSTSAMESSGVSCALEKPVGFGGNPVVWCVCHHTHNFYTRALEADQSFHHESRHHDRFAGLSTQGARDPLKSSQ